MTPEQVLMSLYNRRAEMEAETIRKYQMGIGLPYTDELREIDKQIEEIKKRVPSSSISLFGTIEEKTPLQKEVEKRAERIKENQELKKEIIDDLKKEAAGKISTDTGNYKITDADDLGAAVKIEQLKEKIEKIAEEKGWDLSNRDLTTAEKKKIDALKEEIYNLEFELKSLEYDEKHAIEECTEQMRGRGITVEGARAHYNPIRKEYELKKFAVSEKLDKAKFQYNILCLKVKPSEGKVVLPNPQKHIPKILIKTARLDERNYLLEINNGEKVISFKSKKKGGGVDRETKQFKILHHLWDFLWELKDGKVLKKGDFASLENLVRGSGSESTEAAYKHIQRLNNRFRNEGVAIEIRGENEKYRLIINKA